MRQPRHVALAALLALALAGLLALPCGCTPPDKRAVESESWPSANRAWCCRRRSGGPTATATSKPKLCTPTPANTATATAPRRPRPNLGCHHTPLDTATRTGLATATSTPIDTATPLRTQTTCRPALPCRPHCHGNRLRRHNSTGKHHGL